ncbi:MAG: SUMF1/EgtB/PvdO family nonheme iron enzyme [Acidobacteriota bacterium]
MTSRNFEGRILRRRGMAHSSQAQVAFPVVVAIPAGRPAREKSMTVTAFEIGRTPVTNAGFAPFLESHSVPPPPWWADPDFSDPSQPVVGVTWEEASLYCEWLSARDAATWRLPAEDEWERAMSGGAENPATAWGDQVPPGEIPEGDLRGPWRVGLGTPNPYGVLDPGTVVHEWCLGWREPETPAAPGSPPAIPRRASRGGSWRHRVRWSAPSARSSLPPHFRYSDYGFRVLRAVVEEPD